MSASIMVCLLFLEMSQGLPNHHLSHLKKDTLYHLGYSTDDDLKALFGDVKVNSMNLVSVSFQQSSI